MGIITPVIMGVLMEPTAPPEDDYCAGSIRRRLKFAGTDTARMPQRGLRAVAHTALVSMLMAGACAYAQEPSYGSADYGGYGAADSAGADGPRSEPAQYDGLDFGGLAYRPGFQGCSPERGWSVGQGLRTDLIPPPTPPAQGEQRYVRLGLTVAETYTDNVTLASDENAESDFITQVVPSLEACANSGRIRAALSYQLQALYYQNNSEFNDIYNHVTGETSIEVVPSRLYLDANTSYGQTVINPRNTFSRTNLQRPGNRTSAWLTNVSPYALQGLGPVGLATLRYRYGLAEYGDDLPGTTLHGVYFNVTSPPENSLWSWQANVFSQRVERSDGDFDAFFDDSDIFDGDDFDNEDGRTTYFDRATLDLGYQLTNSLTLLALGGVENRFNPDGSTDRLSEPLWNAGFRWISGANSLEARYGERYYGSNYFVEAARRGPNFDFSLNYQEEMTMSGLSQLNGGALGGVGSVGGFRQPSTSLLDRGVFLQKRLLATLGYDTAFTRTTLRAYDVTRDFVQLDSGEDFYGADLQVEYAAGVRTSVTPHMSWQHRDYDTNAEADIAEAGIRLTYLLAPKAQAALGYSHGWRNAETESGSYEENRIVVQFSTYY